MSNTPGWHSRDAAIDDALICGCVVGEVGADTADCFAAALRQGKEGCGLRNCPGEGWWVHLAGPCMTESSVSYEAISDL